MQLGVLKLEQQKIFKKLKHFPKFYLVGGTALALQIGHRISVDFDLFSPNEIPRNLLGEIKRIFSNSEIDIILNHSEQLSVKIDGVKIDFVKYNFPLVLNLIKSDGIKLISVREIAAMKAFAIGQRGTLKDYADLYFILKEGYSTLEEIKKFAEEKYKNEFNFRLFLEQIVYLEDIKDMKMEFLKEKITRDRLQEFFKEEIKKLKI